MKRLGRRLMAGCLFLAAAASVQAQPTCSLAQITSTSAGASTSPAINATGNRIAFTSTANLLGSNPDGSSEIFLWDASTGFTQITNSNLLFGFSTSDASINAAGNRIAFRSNTDPLGSNGDFNTEIFLWDESTGLTQITNTTGGGNFSPAIDAAGTRIAFQSSANPLGNNGDLNPEIFLWDASTGLAQITNTSGALNLSPAISANGLRIAFRSEANLVGGNGDANFEIFLWNASTGLTQVTNTTSGDSSSPTINGAGGRIAFASSSNLTGDNVDGSSEIFLWDATAGFIQVTNSINFLSSSLPSINAAGNRIAFHSNADLVGNGSVGDEIFLWDESSGFTQITNTQSGTLIATINAMGDRTTFLSGENLLGTNNEGNLEIFLAFCPLILETSIPAVSPLGLVGLAALLGLAAAWTLRRRRA